MFFPPAQGFSSILTAAMLHCPVPAALLCPKKVMQGAAVSHAHPTRLFQYVLACSLICMLLAWPAPFANAQPTPGAPLPALPLIAPDRPADAASLGTIASGAAIISVADLQGESYLIEIVGRDCQFCHTQASLFSGLQQQRKRATRSDQVKVLAIASGATQKEINFLRARSGSPYLSLLTRRGLCSAYSSGGTQDAVYSVDAQGRHRALNSFDVIEDLDTLFPGCPALGHLAESPQ